MTDDIIEALTFALAAGVVGAMLTLVAIVTGSSGVLLLAAFVYGWSLVVIVGIAVVSVVGAFRETTR